MSVKRDFPDPSIKLVFKGLVIAALKQGNPFAEVGALMEALCHKPKLLVKRVSPSMDKEPKHKSHPISSVSLNVEGTTRTTIETYKGAEAFNRGLGTGDIDDFRWYVDIEAELNPGKEYTPEPGSLKPIFRFNNALCYSQSVPDGRLMIKRGQGAAVLFGRIAEEIGANIYLDQPESKATLLVDGKNVLTVDAAQVASGVRYTIEFDCECDLDIRPRVSDFGMVYGALNPATPADQQIDFEKEVITGSLPANPQVRCIGGVIPRLKTLT